MKKLEELEGKECSLPMIFAEILKDEVNANDERDIYKNVLEFVKKYGDKGEIMSAVNEFTSSITGGASLEEIMHITHDEAVSPTFVSALTVDETCKLDKKH